MFCEHEQLFNFFSVIVSEGKVIRVEEQRMLEVEEVIGIVM